MGKDISIEIINGPEVQQWLKVETAKTAQLGWDAVANTALKVMDSMKRFILPSVITGRLRASVHIEANDSRLRNLKGASSGEGNFPSEDRKFDISPKAGEALVGTNVIYAKSVDDKGRARGYFIRAAKDGEAFIEAYLKRNKDK